jgi:sigma-E factor negative regulatory protein RseC
MGGGKETKVEAINQAGAQVGDKIMLSFKTTSLLKAMSLLYLFPILCLMAGAGIGLKIGEAYSMDVNLSSLLTALLFLVLSIWFVKSKGNRLSAKSEYQPKIIKVVKEADSALSSSEQEPVQV